MLAHHLLPVLITLFSSLFIYVSGISSSGPPAFPVSPVSHLAVIDAAVACDQLKTTAPKLLAHLDDEPLTITNVISLIYTEGANPSTTVLFDSIPEQILQPAANIPGAIKSVGEWRKTDVMADYGYGQEDSVQTVKGGLPAFCRFGASITTSKMSNVWFEVWMPLPSNTTVTNATSTTTTTSQSSTSSHAATTTSHSSTMSHTTITSHASSSSHSTSVATVKAEATGASVMHRRHHKHSNKHKKSSKKKKKKSSGKKSSKKTSSKKKPFSTSKKQTTTSKKMTTTTSKKMTTMTSKKMTSSSTVKKSTSTSSTKTAATATSTAPVTGRAPNTRWRGRVVFVGNAGQLGGVNYPEMKQILTRYHEVAVSSNAGHFGSGSTSNWTIGNPQSQLDFGQRGVSVASRASQAIVKSFYGIADRTDSDGSSRVGFNNYFKGCSTGGRQGFSEAQVYPNDYDGIIAGSPAVYYNDLNAYQIHVNYLQSNTSSPGYIPLTLYPLIHEHIINQCDLNDGVMDAVIEDPSSCSPNFDQLLCPSSDMTMTNSDTTTMSTTTSSSSTNGTSASNSTANCLTPAQLDNLADIYTALTYPDGTIIHEPVLYGSEFSWTVTDGVVGNPFPPAPGWFQYQVLNQTTDASSFNPYTVVEGNFSLIALGDRINPGRTNTNNADLTSFFDRGSKLIHYHGLADQLIPSGASDRFFHSVHSSSSPADSIADSYRYFHIPGMAHCRGGDGAYNFGGASQTADPGSRPLQYDADHDMLVALFQWTESGIAPEYFVGAAYKNAADEAPYNIGTTTDQRPYSNGVKFTHKMCPYPQQAVLSDPSSPYDATSLTCEDPS